MIRQHVQECGRDDSALVNDNDPDGDTLTIISVRPTNGLALISGQRMSSYSDEQLLGTATVGLTIIDGFGGTNSALIAST